MLKRLLLVLVLVAGLSAAGAWWMLWASPGPAEAPTTIVVEPGASLARVARQLEEEGAIPGTARTFRTMARLFGSSDPIQAGEFEIPPGMSGARVLDHLQHGQPVRRFVTIPEGMPSVIVRDRLMAVEELVGEIEVPAEGSVLPSTYDYRRGETRAAVLERMQQAMTRALDELWPQRQPNAMVNSREEAVILASIVEKETAKAEEYGLVAGVLTNRLRIGMMLGADATTIYPITRGRPLGREIRVSELRDRNPYNTRAVAGLPPGPITNPGRATIEAVLKPAETDALFYVADGTGGHVFARTYQEHQANVRRWREFRREHGL
ncbi:MAG: endolytic transglycosylase MltG [Allosphingosinicella sp.]|uniref:endolytic transglycosylase MltG n=1 Tax=Allosphingosinicella sp. TaxID=2823234 RepID=UPI00393EC012